MHLQALYLLVVGLSSILNERFYCTSLMISNDGSSDFKRIYFTSDAFHKNSQKENNINDTASDNIVYVLVDLSSSYHDTATDTKFLSVTIDSYLIHWKFKGLDLSQKMTQIVSTRTGADGYPTVSTAEKDLIRLLVRCALQAALLYAFQGVEKEFGMTLSARIQMMYNRSTLLQTLAHALSPCEVRLGGTQADLVTFDPNSESDVSFDGLLETAEGEASFWEDRLLQGLDGFVGQDGFNGEKLTNFTLSGALWKSITGFFHKVGWDLMFDFNLFKWHGDLWDPSNAQLLLNYSNTMGYDIATFQLGNEPNLYQHTFNFSVEPKVLAKDFEILRNLISKFPRYRKSQLIGPDVTNLDRRGHSSKEYLKKFLQAGGNKLVAQVSLHHYYMSGRVAKVGDFVDVNVLDTFKMEIEAGLNITQSQPLQLPISFTETSSCSSAGAPGLSNAYVAGFLWLDKLGLAAKYGVRRVFRQTFFGGNYALLATSSLPNPDYYLSVLHKRLILGPVLNITIQPVNKLLRLYAHCARTDFYNFAKGSVTLAYLNVDKRDHTLTLPQFHGQPYFLYVLSPGDADGLTSRSVKLNGRLLEIVDGRLPPLVPRVVQGNATLPALTFGFVVLPKANVAICKNYSPLP